MPPKLSDLERIGLVEVRADLDIRAGSLEVPDLELNAVRVFEHIYWL